MSKAYFKTSQSKWRKGTVKVLEAFEKDPAKMNDLLDSNKDVVRELAGNSEDVDAVKQELSENPLVRLFTEANGDIDANELMRIVNDDSNPTRASGVMALLDGKLDINDFITLYKMFNKGSGASSLLSLLGGQSQQNTSTNPLAALLGNNQKPAQQQSSNQLLSALLGTQQQAQAQNTDTGQLTGVLQSLLGASAQATTPQQGFTLDQGQATNNTSSSSLGSMFDLAGLLLGKK